MPDDKKTANQRLLTIVLGVVVFICMLVLIYFQVQGLKQARANADSEQAALTQMQSRVTQLIKLKNEAPAMQQQLDLCNQLIPDEGQESTLITDLQSMADSAGVQFLEVHFDARVAKAGYIEMPVKFSFDGHNDGMLLLLNSMQGWKRAIRIDAVQIGKGKGDLPEIRADITGTAFFKAKNAVPAGAVQPGATTAKGAK